MARPKGIPAWNKKEHLHKTCVTCGQPFSVKQSLDRITHCSGSCGAKGRKAWNKGLVGLKAGADSPHWKGGITPENKLLRQRFRATMWMRILTRDNFTCQICEQYGGSLQVDHIKPWKDYPELRFSVDNCRTLCMACHYYITFKRRLPQGVIWGHGLKWRIGS